MPRRIVLHPGFHKTGTSSIQHLLRENRVALKPFAALRLHWQLRELVQATRGYSTWRDPLTLIKVQDRFETLLDGVPGMPRRTLIISSEELSGHMPGRGDLADYSAAPVLLYAMWEILHRRYPQAEIVIHLSTRAPDDWLTSAYWEHVKASSMTLDLDAFVERYHAAAALDEMVAEIASRVPCAVHHSALDDSRDLPLGPASPLLDLCGVPDDVLAGLTVPPPANTRLPADILLALLDANRNLGDPDTRRAAKADILKQARPT
tara:strand:+ start:10209 stop:10997 length:789 start_codon:yes stop_codon:yes gene_type:complete